MKRLYIICEGPTEQEFCHAMLAPYLGSKGIQVITPLIKKSGGGIVAWDILKKQIEGTLADTEGTVTTLIDYYGIKPIHAFPNWTTVQAVGNRIDKMDQLETAMQADIRADRKQRFIPYVQLHEFEGLLFNNLAAFTQTFEDTELHNVREIEDIINRHQNPEMINDGAQTAPSKRLANLIKGYNKVVYGNILAEEIGLPQMRSKSVRFNEWLNKLEAI